MNKFLLITSLCLVSGLAQAADNNKELTRAQRKQARKLERAQKLRDRAMATDGKAKDKLMKKGAALERPTCMLYVIEKEKEKRAKKNKGKLNAKLAKKWITKLETALEAALKNDRSSLSTKRGCARDLRDLYSKLAIRAKRLKADKYDAYRAACTKYGQLYADLHTAVDDGEAKAKLKKDALKYDVDEAVELPFDEFLVVMRAQINK